MEKQLDLWLILDEETGQIWPPDLKHYYLKESHAKARLTERKKHFPKQKLQAIKAKLTYENGINYDFQVDDRVKITYRDESFGKKGRIAKVWSAARHGTGSAYVVYDEPNYTEGDAFDFRYLELLPKRQNDEES